jgi:sugar phosphate isomerase/epimerase
MLGLSSSYYGFQGKRVFESAKTVFDLGFDTVELGAGHGSEPKVWAAVKKIKKDFPNKSYTLHGLFPPLEKRFWFNASLGLTPQNKRVVEGFFKAASLLEAKVVSIHPGFEKNPSWPKGKGGMAIPVYKGGLLGEKAWAGFLEIVGKCASLSHETGCAFAIENLPKMAFPLVHSKKDFDRVFADYSEAKLLLDTGHALFEGRLAEFLEAFPAKVAQLHLHFSHEGGGLAKIDEHLPITSQVQLEPLRAIKNLSKIPIIFEHGTSTSQEEILAEKKIVEEWIGTL